MSQYDYFSRFKYDLKHGVSSATAPLRFVVFMAMVGAVQRLLQLQTDSTAEQHKQNAHVTNAHCNGNGNEVALQNKSAIRSKGRSVICEELLERYELSQISM